MFFRRIVLAALALVSVASSAQHDEDRGTAVSLDNEVCCYGIKNEASM
jgi:hypothetical protein